MNHMPISVIEGESILSAAREQSREKQSFSQLLADTLALKRFEGKGEADVFVAAYGGPYGAEEYAHTRTRHNNACVRGFCIEQLNRTETKDVLNRRDTTLITRFSLSPA